MPNNSILIVLLQVSLMMLMMVTLMNNDIGVHAAPSVSMTSTCCYNETTTAWMGPTTPFTGSTPILRKWGDYELTCPQFGYFMPPITDLNRRELLDFYPNGSSFPGFIGLEFRSWGESPFYYVMAGRYKDYLYDGYPFGNMDTWWVSDKATDGKVALTMEGRYRIVSETEEMDAHYCGREHCTNLQDCFSQGMNVGGSLDTQCTCGGCSPGFNGTYCNEFSIGGDNFTLLNITNGSTLDELRSECQSVPGRDMFSIPRDKEQWDELQDALTPSHRYFINVIGSGSQWVGRGGRYDTLTVSEGSTIARGYAEWAAGEGSDTTRGSCADMTAGKIHQSKCKGHRYGICVSLSCALVDCGDQANYVSGIYPNCFCNCTDGTSGAEASGGNGKCKSNPVAVAPTSTPTKVPLGISSGVFVGVTVVTAVGGFGTLTDSSNSLQLAAMLSNMSCSTVETTNQALEYLLSPIRIADTKANKLIGSFVLVAGITILYAIAAAAILTIVQRVGDQEGDAPEQRVSRFKGFILYPHFPVLVSVLFLPGVVFESGSLLYGNKSGGAWYAVLLAVVGMILSLLLVGYHVTVGILATRRISAARKKSLSIDANDDERPQHNQELTQEEGKAFDTTTTPMDHPTNSRNPVDDSIVHSEDHAASPIASSGPHDDNDLQIPDSNPNEVPVSPRSDGESQNPDDPDDCTPIKAIGAEKPCQADDSPQQIESPTKQQAYNGADDVSNHSFVSHDDDGLAAEPPVPAAVSRWFVKYSDVQRGHLPAFLATILLAEGYYGPAAQQSMYAAITGISLHSLAVMCAHNVVQVFLVSIVAAIDGSDRSTCDAVQGVIAAICFVHGILIIALRCYRVPVLNVLQFIQSIVLGLLACSGFIQNAAAQAAFSIAMMVITIVTCVLMLAIAFLEWRLRASASKVQTPAAADTSAYKEAEMK